MLIILALIIFGTIILGIIGLSSDLNYMIEEDEEQDV